MYASILFALIVLAIEPRVVIAQEFLGKPCDNATEFKCKTSTLCVPKIWICDGTVSKFPSFPLFHAVYMVKNVGFDHELS